MEHKNLLVIMSSEKTRDLAWGFLHRVEKSILHFQFRNIFDFPFIVVLLLGKNKIGFRYPNYVVQGLLVDCWIEFNEPCRIRSDDKKIECNFVQSSKNKYSFFYHWNSDEKIWFACRIFSMSETGEINMQINCFQARISSLLQKWDRKVWWKRIHIL